MNVKNSSQKAQKYKIKDSDKSYKSIFVSPTKLPRYEEKLVAHHRTLH